MRSAWLNRSEGASGFTMMPNETETWKVGDKAFQYRGTTGFMITVDMSSDDVSD